MDEVSDSEIRELMEAGQSPQQLAVRRRVVERTFEDNAAMAALQIIDLAQNSPNDKIRFEASKYIVERTIGKIVEKAPDEGNHWENVFANAAVYREPSKHELGHSNGVIDGESTELEN